MTKDELRAVKDKCVWFLDKKERAYLTTCHRCCNRMAGRDFLFYRICPFCEEPIQVVKTRDEFQEIVAFLASFTPKDYRQVKM